MCTRAKTKRRGFLFTMPLMLGMGVIVFAAMIAISQLFVTIGGPMVPDLLADMPTIFRYAEDGSRIPEYAPVLSSDYVIEGENGAKLSESEFAEEFPALAMYGLMVKIAAGIFVILLMLAGISYFFEEFNIVRQGTAYNIIAKMLILIPIYLVLPYLWDMTALLIESSSLYLMDPFGGDPRGRTSELWCLMGSVTCSVSGQTSVDPLEIFDDIGSFDHEEALSQDIWNNALQNPFFGEGFVVDVLLALFKGFAIMFMTAMMFVLSAIRVLLTEIIVISFPLVSAVGLIPWINTAKIYDMFQQNLIGLSMAPIMSALVLSVGMSTIDSQSMPPLRMWFQLLSIGFLAVFFPVMLSPMLANLSSKVGTMLSTTLTSVSMAGSMGLRGATGRMSGMPEVGGGKGAGGMTGAGEAPPQNPRFESADVGTATSGVSPGGSHSAMDKMAMYGSTGMTGGLEAAAMQPGITGQQMPAGESDTGQADSSNAEQTDGSTMMNPGEDLDSMLKGGEGAEE